MLSLFTDGSSDHEPPTAVPEQSAADHRMEDTPRVSLTVRLQTLKQRPQRLEKQQGSEAFRITRENRLLKYNPFRQQTL